MLTLDTTPTYNLKVVVQETGIKPDTLRAWERRYGLPQPIRSSGKHRLYSRYDIEVIKWLVLRQAEGLSISHCVELWQNLIEAGQNPLEVYAPFTPYEPEIEGPPIINLGSPLEEIRRAWIEACMAFDEARAEQILTQAFALYPPVMVCLEVLQKGLARMGEMWYQSTATVQQEHFASALAMRRLNALVSAAPAPNRPGRLVVACPAQEDHIFAPLLLTLMLRYNGWDVVYLGANVPITRLETMIHLVSPSLLIMTAQQMHTAANLMQVAEMMQWMGVPMAYGGRIFNYLPALRERIPGCFLGERLEDTVRSVSNVLAKKVSPMVVKPVEDSYQRAIHHYRHYQATLESKVWQLLQGHHADYEHIANANLYMSRDIVAALRLGDMTLLGSQITWTERLMLNYHLPPEILHHYLEAYYLAARENLGEDGRPVVGWLEGLDSMGQNMAEGDVRYP